VKGGGRFTVLGNSKKIKERKHIYKTSEFLALVPMEARISEIISEVKSLESLESRRF